MKANVLIKCFEIKTPIKLAQIPFLYPQKTWISCTNVFFFSCLHLAKFVSVSGVWATRPETQGTAAGTPYLHLYDSVWPQECVDMAEIRGRPSLGQKSCSVLFSSLDVSLTYSLLVYCWLTVELGAHLAELRGHVADCGWRQEVWVCKHSWQR